MLFSEGDKMQISPKLGLCRANQDQIRNQGPRLPRNTLFYNPPPPLFELKPVPIYLHKLITHLLSYGIVSACYETEYIKICINQGKVISE